MMAGESARKSLAKCGSIVLPALESPMTKEQFEAVVKLVDTLPEPMRVEVGCHCLRHAVADAGSFASVERHATGEIHTYILATYDPRVIAGLMAMFAPDKN
jgi:hypothetical protein